MADSSGAIPAAQSDRFQLLVNAVTDYAIYMLDREGNVATWNPGARRFKDYGAEEIIGQHFSRFFTPEDLEARLPWRALELAATEGRFEAEGWRVRKDGGRFWAHVVLDPVRADDGTVIGFAKITRDITERKRAEQALFESEQRFRVLVQGVRDYAIYMLDTNGFITNWNAGAEAIKGYSAEQVIGRHVSIFYTDEDRERGVPERALATALAEGRYETEALRRRIDGTLFWANVVIDPIYNDQGEHIGFAKITRDITDRKYAQEELEATRAALAQAQKLQALGELTGGIAHDFNNLITVIRGSAELLSRGDLPAERRQRYLEAITSTADRAATLTSHLLAFSRRQALQPEVIDLNVRLDAFADVLARTLGSTVEVRLDLAPGLWLVEADPTQLETALLNAAINDRDAMPEGGTICLATANKTDESGEELVCVAITDSGWGMPAEVVERAFEPFFTTKPTGKGTGLGLSQIHGFAAQTGGRAEIESREGKGTTIRLLLPRTHRARSAAAAAAAAELPSLPSGLTVLLVEDNEQVRAFATQLLEDLGFAVAAAASGEEALKMVGERPFDLLFSDVVMPGISGIELARRLREQAPQLPVLLATGYSADVLKGDAQGFELVRKPYSRDALIQALARTLAAPKRLAAPAEA